MKNRKIHFSLLVIPLIVMTGTVFPQNNDLTDKLNSELERTDEIIERAREVVQVTRSPQAKAAFDQAVQLQGQARNWFRQGPGGGNYRRCGEYTLKAREYAQKAISAGRLTAQNENIILRKLEQAEDYLARIRQQVNELPDRSSPSYNPGIYQALKDNLDRAWELYRSQHYKAALKLANQVVMHAEKLLKSIEQSNRSQGNYQRRIETTRQFIEQTEEIVVQCGSPTAERLFHRAKETFNLGENMAADRRFTAALKALQSAHDLAGKAARECGGLQSLQQKYEKLRHLADQAAEIIEPSDEISGRLLDQAKKQLDLARDHLDDNHIEAAVAALKAAQMTLDRLKTHINQTDF